MDVVARQGEATTHKLSAATLLEVVDREFTAPGVEDFVTRPKKLQHLVNKQDKLDGLIQDLHDTLYTATTELSNLCRQTDRLRPQNQNLLGGRYDTGE